MTRSLPNIPVERALRPSRLAAPVPARPNVVALRSAGVRCAAAGMRDSCLPAGLEAGALRALDSLFGIQARVRKREALYRSGEAFTALYAIRLGSFKTLVLAEDGRQHVTGYHIGGDIVGLDGIGKTRHGCEAIALEDSEVCAVPFAKLDEMALHEPILRRNLFRLVSRDVGHGQDMMVLLGSMRAEERVAVYLLDLAERYRSRGYSSSEFLLRMTREEIASYLGLTLETVSRIFSRLHEEGLVQVQGRAIKLLDLPSLKHLAGRRH